MSRKALIVGINYYENITSLHGCVNDAKSVKKVLEQHGDDEGSKNFDCLLLAATDEKHAVSKSSLKKRIRDLFESDSDIALLYFAGHGYVETVGGYLLTSDVEGGDDGVSLAEILKYANISPAKNKLIILDSCHSGYAGSDPMSEQVSSLSEGLTVLTASTVDQYAMEKDGQGLFTSLLVDALGGAAANLTGDITPGSIYAHIDQSLGAWEQRPVFKTNVKEFVSLRKVKPPLTLPELRRIVEFFPEPGSHFELDPSFEPRDEGRTPEMPVSDPENTERFAVLQKYNRVNLVVPVGAPHMWHAAMESKSCRLTALGEHYRRLVKNGRI